MAADTGIYHVTKSAFTQARNKLKHSAFIELDQTQIDFFYKNVSYKTWHGFRLIAVDGSTLSLPVSKATQEHFGLTKTNNKDQKVVLARISQAFDPLNHITLDASMYPMQTSEQSMMVGHIEKMAKGDLAIYDRNYRGFWVYKLHQTKEIDFCSRLQTKSGGKTITDFLNSGRKDEVVDITCNTREAKQQCKKLGLDTHALKCRLLRIEIEGEEEPELLITSLTDQEAYPYEYFEELYQKRWPVEEDFKFLKYRAELGKFTGKSVEAIYQDFYAKIFMANLTSILAFDANTEIAKTYSSRKHSYKINWSNALRNMANTGFLLFLRKNTTEILNQLLKLFLVDPVCVRPHRKFQRNIRRRNHRFNFCYKQLC